MQRNWIGRSEGTQVDFFLEEQGLGTIDQGLEEQDAGPSTPLRSAQDDKAVRIRVFTTRVDTIFGATSVQLEPQHALVAAFTATDADLKAQVDELLDQQKKAREAGDLGAIEKHGIPTGHFGVNYIG